MEKVSLNALNDAIKEIRKVLNVHSATLMRIEAILSSYTDMHELNKQNDIKLATRVRDIETKLSIQTIPELTIKGI